jgi:hypothetical protein
MNQTKPNQTKKMKTEFEILSANRSFCNESEAKDMAGCLADGGVVVCYFPTQSAMRQASLFTAAPEMLAALQLVYSNAGESPEWIRARIGSVIAKAEGKA